MELEEKWGKKYSYAIKSCKSNWDVISPFFKFPAEVRIIMYTTNLIEGLHRQFGKVTKIGSIIFGVGDRNQHHFLYKKIETNDTHSDKI